MTEQTGRRLSVLARLKDITQARDFVTEAAETAGLEPRAVYHCQVAVDEALTNIIEHGYGGGDAEARIELRCVVEGGRFVITVIDDSPPFDPLAHGEPEFDIALDDREPGGWGIFFIKKMMDEVTYNHVEGRNYLRLTKYLPAMEEEPPEGIGRRQVAAGVWVLSLTGRLDSLASQTLESALRAEIDAGHLCLIVDMSRVSYIASGGLKALVGAWRRATRLNGAVALVGLQPHVREVFEMLGFDQIFPFHANIEQALEAIRLEADCGF